MNLVINARDAMPDGGQLAIETCNCEIDDRGTKSSGLGKPGHVMIAVSDNGCGMDEKTRGQIFEPFFTTKAQGKGTGLGLAIVSDIVKQSGGQIFVQSEAGLGTTFKVCLPRVDGATQDHIAGPEESSVDGHETILLVEDEQTVRDSTAEYLEQHGYAVIKANGGPQALSLANHIDQPIHLMLTDVIMPQMSGRDLAEKIMEIHPETKIVFISGYSSNLLSNRQVLDPRHVLLQKPIRLSFLGKRLREILDHTNGASAGK
jgi:CheY-like chemotaxis protein